MNVIAIVEDEGEWMLNKKYDLFGFIRMFKPMCSNDGSLLMFQKFMWCAMARRVP